MEIILSVLFIIGFILFVRAQEVSAFRKIHCEKANNDKFMNDLSQSQVNYNIMSGKYNKPVAANKSNKDTWEDFKKRHPHGSWN